MHNAPSVVYPVGRCVFYAMLLALIGLVSAAVGATFLSGLVPRSGHPWGWTAVSVGAFAWAVWVAVAVTGWLRSPEGSLSWDPDVVQEEGGAGAWSWCGPPSSEPVSLSQMECVVDLQNRILLRFRSANAGPRWIWVERRGNSARWSDLRRALVSSRA